MILSSVIFEIIPNKESNYLLTKLHFWGWVVVQVDQELRYKPEGLGFDSQWYYSNF